ncbi:MAG TPA: YbbR-like domain-containing protein [Longimicrobiales bacterium]
MRTLLRMVVHNWTLKLTSLLLAVLLWTLVQAERTVRTEITGVPIEVVVHDPEWRLSAPPAPTTATVVVSGPYRELIQLAGTRPHVTVLIDEVTDSTELVPLETRLVQLDSDLPRARILDVRPSSVLLTFERLTTRLVPVAIRTRGQLPPGLELTGPLRADPPVVRASGPEHRLRTLDSVPLFPVDLAEVNGPAALTVGIDTTRLQDLIFAPRSIAIFIPVAAAPDTLGADTTTAAPERDEP